MQELNHNPKGDSETELSYLNAISESGIQKGCGGIGCCFHSCQAYF